MALSAELEHEFGSLEASEDDPRKSGAFERRNFGFIGVEKRRSDFSESESEVWFNW